jgi:LysM repeat protein
MCRTFLLFFVLPAFILSHASVPASAGSAYDLINAVNSLRASYNLAPYDIDADLMSVAQGQSDYQASIQTRTHSRADGTGPGDHGISSENIAGGSNITINGVIGQWTDYWHLFTMIGFTSGQIGAGMAEANGIAYYTLDVINTGTKTGLPEESVGTATSQSNQQAISPGITATVELPPTDSPQEDGSIIHKVQPGEALWSIALAYNTTILELCKLNGLDSNNPVIYAGQDLIIQRAYTVTPTATITLTPTKTLHPTRTTRPLDITSTPHPLSASGSTQPPLIPDASNPKPVDSRTLGITILSVCILGLVGIMVGRYWMKK